MNIQQQTEEKRNKEFQDKLKRFIIKQNKTKPVNLSDLKSILKQIELC